MDKRIKELPICNNEFNMRNMRNTTMSKIATFPKIYFSTFLKGFKKNVTIQKKKQRFININFVAVAKKYQFCFFSIAIQVLLLKLPLYISIAYIKVLLINNDTTIFLKLFKLVKKCSSFVSLTGDKPLTNVTFENIYI